MKHCNTLFYCIKVNSYYNAENASIKLMYAHYLIYIYLRYLRLITLQLPPLRSKSKHY
ncbi:hypothetical protein Plhal304r1_c035g0109661 [Plasmopara halstedii]